MAVTAAQKSVWLWAIPATGAIVCLAWTARLTSYRKLNRAKFAVRAELEAELPTAPFAREREIYRRDRRRSLCFIEHWIPGCFFLPALCGDACRGHYQGIRLKSCEGSLRR